MTEQIFSVQDETGTITQLTIQPSPGIIVNVGDVGVYGGFPDDGTALEDAPVSQLVPFTVTQVLDGQHFSVGTTNANLADWPASGVITWKTGLNAGMVSQVLEIDGANAYIDVPFFLKYHHSRGNVVPSGASPAMMQAAIVQATDYLDQRYRYQGVKLLQTIGFTYFDPAATFVASWLTPYAVDSTTFLTPSTSTQSTEWPRQGVVDYNGDTINGIPKQIQAACAELAIRVLNGTQLQPDYDSSLVSAGGVVSSVTSKIGPLEKITSYDTKLGLGFFASFPIVDRMLSRAGLLLVGGGRTVMR